MWSRLMFEELAVWKTQASQDSGYLHHKSLDLSLLSPSTVNQSQVQVLPPIQSPWPQEPPLAQHNSTIPSLNQLQIQLHDTQSSLT